MKQKFISILLLCAAQFFLKGAPWQELSFYEVRPAASPIAVDGCLSDKAWGSAAVHRAYYEYFKTSPGPSALQTELRILYDGAGIYVGVINYGDSSKLRRFISEIHSPDLWKDDCGELYFDHAADGIGYRRFVISCTGRTYDMMRQDAAVVREEWNGIGWIARTSIEKDRWILEAFFPWCDLGAEARPGALWGFLHARFAWPGKFIGAVSSPGGSYMNTQAFTTLYFSGKGETLSLSRIGEVLDRKSSRPWLMQYGESILFNSGSGLRTENLALFLRQAEQRFRRQADAVSALLEDYGGMERRRGELERLAAVPSGNLKGTARFFRFEEKSEALRQLCWKIRLEHEFQ